MRPLLFWIALAIAPACAAQDQLCDLIRKNQGFAPPAAPETYAFLDRVGKLIGTPTEVRLFPTSSALVSKRAAAQLCGPGLTERWVFYDGAYLNSLSLNARNFVLAHEAAHHIAGDSLISTFGSWTPEMELRADYSAAFWLTRLGVTRVQLLQAFDELAFPVESVGGYPTRSERRAKVLEAIDTSEPVSTTSKLPVGTVRGNPTVGLNVEALAVALVIATYLLWYLVLRFALLRARPLTVFQWNESLAKLDYKLPGWLGGATVPLRNVLLFGLFRDHPRVLDAWVSRHLAEARRTFEENFTYAARKVYVPLPVVLNSRRIAELKPEHLQKYCGRARWCMLIRGEGGLGKTTLACQLALWSMADDPKQRLVSDRRAIPVLIEAGLDFNVLKDITLFRREILGRLKRLVGETGLHEELLNALLTTRRVLVILDGLSEMPPLADDSSRARLDNPDFPVAALIVTSRNDEALREEITVLPSRIDKEHLIGFISGYMAQFGMPDLQDTVVLAARQRLVEMLTPGMRGTTPLLAKLYGEQLVTISTSGQHPLDQLPATVPDLMLSYVSSLNRSRQHADPDNPTVHTAAQIASWVCLKDSFRPGKASKLEIRNQLELAQIDISLLKYLDNRLGLVRTIKPAETDIYFLLDPLSEYLAAMWAIKQNEDSENLWRRFIADADSKTGAPETIRGFLGAVRDCCLAKAGPPFVPKSIVDALSKRIAPIDPERIDLLK